MDVDKKTTSSGLAAARIQLPTLFPYLRRYKKGLLVGIVCVWATALFANLVPLVVNKTIKYITTEGSTLQTEATVFLLESVLAHSSQTVHLLPWVWEAQRPFLHRTALAATSRGNELPLYFAAILGFALVSGVFRFLQRRILIGISRQIEYDQRNDFFEHLLKMPPAFFDKMTTGDIVARATNDLNQVRSMLGPGLMYPINAILMMMFAMAGMIYLSPFLTLFALIPPVVMAVGTNRISKTLHDRFTKVQEQYSNISSKVQENLTGIRVVKAYCREDAEVEAIKTLNQDYLEKNLQYFHTMGFLYPFFTFSHNLGRFVVLAVGGWLIMTPGRRFDVGDLTAFFLYLNMLHFPMISIGWVLNVIQRGVASLARINEVLDTEPSIRDPETPVEPQAIEGRIEFRGVSFGYLPDRPVIKDLNLVVEPGKTIGIVGATGSGKSSLTHLIPRFYDPSSGEVLLDGIPLEKYRLATLRRVIGLVSQDHYMFSSTVASNIAFGLAHEDQFEAIVEEASQLADFHDNVMEFPKGYDTMVGERGVTLSGGQRQRAAIARALAINPRILILDDALSAVDTHTEERILEGLRKVMAGRTVLLISHRISTVQNADWIIVLEQGEIVEEGTHADLVSKGGCYASIHRQQQLEEEIEEMTA